MNIEENPTVGRYKKIKKIGEGSYGIVYKAMDTSNEKLVAIKELKIDKEDDGIPAHSLREVGILKTISHSNIIKLVDTIYSKEAGRLFLVFEHMDLSLSRFLEEKKYSKLNPYLCKVAGGSPEHHVPAPARHQAPALAADHPQRHQARQHPGRPADRLGQDSGFRPRQEALHSEPQTLEQSADPLVQGARADPGLQTLLDRNRHLGSRLHILRGAHGKASLPERVRDRPAVQHLQAARHAERARVARARRYGPLQVDFPEIPQKVLQKPVRRRRGCLRHRPDLQDDPA